MKPYYQDDRVTLINNDCLLALREMPDNSVDAIVTDPPYGLSDHKPADVLECLKAWVEGKEYRQNKKGFMGKTWDSWVPGPEVWRECFRVLKPGGHLLCFAGTRTVDLMGIALRLAGFELRDEINWTYGCLSEDTELLIDGRWESYSKAIDKGLALCYDVDDDEFRWEPILEFVEYDYNDTAYRIRGNLTDQIVSRNHRCLIERGGRKVFCFAETLECEARVPVLESVPELLEALPVPHERTGDKKQELPEMCKSNYRQVEQREAQADCQAQGTGSEMSCMREGEVEARCVASEDKNAVLFAGMQRQAAREGMGETRLQRAGGVDCGQHGIVSDQDDWSGKPGVERRSDLLPQTRKLPSDKICAVPRGVLADGAEGRLCDGTSFGGCSGTWKMSGAERGCASSESRPTGQSTGKSGTVRQQSRTQIVRGERYTVSDLARVEPFHYRGKVWCVRVPSGAFVARRNGKVFVTGNSGFPKSLDVSKAIDKAAGAEREVVGKSAGMGKQNPEWNGTAQGRAENSFKPEYDITAPSTDAAKQWAGWGTALKPAHEPILLCRKPLDGTVAENVLAHGTGGLNIDGCRVGTEAVTINTWDDGAKPFGGGAGHEYTGRTVQGRWPANLIHDGSDEVVGLFPMTGVSTGGRIGKKSQGSVTNVPAGKYEAGDPGFGDSGSAARFFYCAKASRADRDEGCEGLEERGKRATAINQTRPVCNICGCGTIVPGPGKRLKCGHTDIRFEPSTRDKHGNEEGRRNHHPTVKPTALMRYLCRLITPPNGIVLDPFMGSGSTGKACVLEGFNFIGIEQDAEYCEIARARIRYAQEHGDSEGPKPEVTKKEGPTPTSTSEPTSTTKEQLTFFDFGKDSV